MTDSVSSEKKSLRQKVSEAIYGVSVNRARERVSCYDLQLKRIERVFLRAKSEADRSTAILMFALAEDMMLSGIKENCDSNFPGGWDSVTGGNGLLATASDRLAFLELMRWVTPNTASDLRIMKSIRNYFAHHADVTDFADKKVTGWISSMLPTDKTISKAIGESARRKDCLSPRELYLLRSVSVIVNLSTELIIGPVAMQERVDPIDIMGDKFEKFPVNIRESRLLIADLSIPFWIQSEISISKF